MQNSLIDQIIDSKYRIVSLLGAGGMGEVYRAEHLRLQRPVAIKVLRSHVATSVQGDESLRRFEREAKTACKIDHPNAVSVFDYGVVGNTPYLVMNLVEGRSLKRQLQEYGKLPRPTALLILEQIASALHQAHSLGIVHRDLKPDNIMLEQQADGQLRALVLDFGLAKIVGDSLSGSGLTTSGETLGTPLYMSPEQVQGVQSSPASDIYSLGIMAFELLAGDVPFRAEQAMSVLYKHLNETPPALREIDPSFPDAPEVEAVIRRALAKTPEERFQSASDFVQHLRSALDGEHFGFTDRFAGVPRNSSVSSSATKLPLVLLAVGMAVILGVSVFAFRRWNESSSPAIVPAAVTEQAPPTGSVSQMPPVGVQGSNPEQFEARLLEAGRLIDANDLVAARPILESLRVQNPRHAHLNFLFSRAYRALGKPIMEIEHLQRALDVEPQNPLYQQAREELRERMPRRVLPRIREKLDAAPFRGEAPKPARNLPPELKPGEGVEPRQNRPAQFRELPRGQQSRLERSDSKSQASIDEVLN